MGNKKGINSDLSKSSLPKILKDTIRHAKKASNSYPEIRLILTTLYWSRSIRLPLDMSFDTITAEPTKVVSSMWLDKGLIREFLKQLGNNPKFFGKRVYPLNFKAYHMTSKSGPTGHALWNSFLDAHNLTPLQRTSIEIVGGEKLSNLLESYYTLSSKIPEFFMSRCT